ncbi:MAG: ADP-ribosyl-[dinitrogen reductase] glycohydrolase [Chlamydiae bacterium]|nr:ADP-ribosyl-[dinitrogen reductase] glycohydrolase [Chlamydiota bacterium]
MSSESISHERVEVPSSVAPENVEKSSSSAARTTVVVLAMIALIAGAVATGILFPHVGYTAFGTLGGGVVLGIALLAIAHLCCKAKTVSTPTESAPASAESVVHTDVPPPVEKKDSAPQESENLTPAQSRGKVLSQARAVDFSESGRQTVVLNNFSIIQPSFARREALEKVQNFFADKEEKMSLRDICAMGIMVGMATGDAIGAPFEFLPFDVSGYNNNGETIHMTPAGIKGAKQFNGRNWVISGQWTDDTSMGLCLADTLIEHKGLDATQLMWAFTDWWHHGYNNAFTGKNPKRSVGLGGNISQSFAQFAAQKLDRATKGPFATTAGDTYTSGNGSLMRLGAVAIAASTKEEAMQMAWEQSKVTHQGDAAAGCCELMASILYEALHCDCSDTDEAKQQIFDSLDTFVSLMESVTGLAKSSPEVGNPATLESENWNWKDENFAFNAERLAAQPGYIGSYAMDGLAMALHCVWTTNSFKEAVLKAISRGGDADTVGAITGQIAGAIYGVDAIPEDWIDAVHQWDRGGEIATRAYLLSHLHDG